MLSLKTMWFPFESPESRAIRENMHADEWEQFKRDSERAGQAAADSFTMVPLLVASVIGFALYPWGLLSFLVAGVIIAFRGRPVRRENTRRVIQALCNTEYARAHGITPENFRPYRFPWTK